MFRSTTSLRLRWLCWKAGIFYGLLFACFLSLSEPTKRRIFYNSIKEGAVYCGVAVAMKTMSSAAQIAGVVSACNPQLSREFFYLGATADSVVRQIVLYLVKGEKKFGNEESVSHSTWMKNRKRLLEIPACSKELEQMLCFLERRWLAKASGFFSTMIDWVCPCYGIYVQIHPDTINTYARDPGTAVSVGYQNRIHAWKKILPHPVSYPLILTRPHDIGRYLPAYFSIRSREKIEEAVLGSIKFLKEGQSFAVLDFSFLCEVAGAGAWVNLQREFSERYKQLKIEPAQIICIQTLKKGEIGGIRLLPLEGISKEEIEAQYRFLLEWVSHFGLAANLVELDRWPIDSMRNLRSQKRSSRALSKEVLTADVKDFESAWTPTSPEQRLMVAGELKVLKGWIGLLSDSDWNQISHCPTRSKLAELYFTNLREQFTQLRQKEKRFFEAAAHFEQIHANVSSLLELASPFSRGDFSSIYREKLSFIPVRLRPFVSCALHNAGMTSVAGLFKAVEETVGGPPRVLYGENSYFENILIAKKISRASLVEEASETDLKEADLLMLQFNPALRRTFIEAAEYRVERIEEILRNVLAQREKKPLTVALDCTFDYIDSPKLAALFKTFQKEIEEGILNIACYRSGLKFDLFGMDNFCGAPFFMVHNRDSKWRAFDSLLAEPALQADRLSLNWFCLAYQFASYELDLYRKTIFNNTRALLNRLPVKLFEKTGTYRIVPMEKEAEAGFLDIKVFGSFHNAKGASLVCGSLVANCLETGHPIFHRRSVGFYHPNISILFGEENATIRLTLGLDPDQVDRFVDSFTKINSLNGF